MKRKKGRSETDEIINNTDGVVDETKRKKIEEEPPPIDPSSSFGNWSDLPDVLLVCILHRLLFSIPDLFAFAAVCSSWRSAAATSSSSFRGPPLLLIPAVSPGLSHWSSPARCRLQTLTGCNGLAAPSRTLTLRRSRIRHYRSMVSSQTLRRKCVGSSYGQLIFVPAGQNAVLADVFTGQEIQSPDFPVGYRDFSFGILTAPLASSSCFLLLVAARFPNNPTSILCWAPGSSNEWSELHYRVSLGNRIVSLVVFKGHVFALTEFHDLIVVELAPMSLKELRLKMSDGTDGTYRHLGKFDRRILVECGNELLLVLCFPCYWRTGRLVRVRVVVYRLDLSKHKWVKMESLGDWCLFIDAVRKHAIACCDPSSWGGRNNCIYFAVPGCDTWVVVPLDVEKLDSASISPFSDSNFTLSKWPSPVWVYPRFVREGIQIEGRAAFSEPSEDDALVQYLDALVQYHCT